MAISPDLADQHRVYDDDADTQHDLDDEPGLEGCAVRIEVALHEWVEHHDEEDCGEHQHCPHEHFCDDLVGPSRPAIFDGRVGLEHVVERPQ